MVSTDDEEIADVARCYGAEVPFFRSKENANDSSGLAEVVIEVLDQYKEERHDIWLYGSDSSNGFSYSGE